MDPFTQKMLERTQARREMLNAKRILAGDAPLPAPRISRSPLKEKNMLAAFDNDKELPPSLATRYSPRKIDAEPTFSLRKTDTTDTHLVDRSPTGKGRSTRLAALAAQINTWEDESGTATSTYNSTPSRPLTKTNALNNVATITSESSGRKSESGNKVVSRQDTRSPSASPRSTGPTIRPSPRKSVGEAAVERAPIVAATHKMSPTLSSPRTSRSPAKATVTKEDEMRKGSDRRSTAGGNSNSLPRQAAVTPAQPSPRRSASTAGASLSKPTPTPFAQATPQKIAGDSVRKTMVWDQAIVAALEAQGYSKSPSKSKLEYKFKRGQQKQLKFDDDPDQDNCSNDDGDSESDSDSVDSKPATILDESCGRVIEPPKQSVRELAQRFKGAAPCLREDGGSGARDPALLPLSARVALFEKEASQQQQQTKAVASSGGAASKRTLVERATALAADSPSKSPPRKKAGSPATAPTAVTLSPSKVGRHTFQIHRQLFENATVQWRENEITAKVLDERKRDMDVVLNRWNRPKQDVAATPPVKSQSVATTTKKSTPATVASPKKVATITPKKVAALTIEKVQSAEKVGRSPAKRIPTPPPLPPPPAAVASMPHFDEDSESEISEQDSLSEPEEEEERVEETSRDWSDHSEEESEQSDVDEEYEDDVQEAVDAVDRAFPEYKDVGGETSEDGLDAEDNDEGGSGDEKIEQRNVGKSYDSELDSSIVQAVFKRIQSHSTLPPAGKVPAKALVNPPKRTRMSPPAAPLAPNRAHQRPQTSEEEDASDDSGPLLHTVSFYRRQQETLRLTPVKTVIRRPQLVSPPLSPDEEQAAAIPQMDPKAFQQLIQTKLKNLQEEVNAQQIIISQTSQAVNHCRATPDFYGSAEQVEGERLLLIATQRRQCCLGEIERLKTEGALAGGSQPPPLCKGSLTIGEIKLPLKREFLQQTANGTSGEFVHFFVCLLKHRAQVIATQMVSTADGISAGAFFLPNLINLHELDHSFSVMLEVYGLQTKRENILRDKKTLSSHKKEKSRLALTPRSKLSKRESRSSVQSPGGPYMVCTSSFSLIGATALNIKTLQRPSWVLDKVPFVSPLEGNVFMKVQCHTDAVTEEKGFLTMFEDVSGFGAWHRRWFVLSRRYLSYWKYPDDVKHKEPIGRVDLRQCVTPNVGLVPRDICARPHTVMLMTVRAPAKDDANSLVQHNYNSYTAIKVLLSADTKEERVIWSKSLNRALESLRTWDPNALRPMPREQN